MKVPGRMNICFCLVLVFFPWMWARRECVRFLLFYGDTKHEGNIGKLMQVLLACCLAVSPPSSSLHALQSEPYTQGVPRVRFMGKTDTPCCKSNDADWFGSPAADSPVGKRFYSKTSHLHACMQLDQQDTGFRMPLVSQINLHHLICSVLDMCSA